MVTSAEEGFKKMILSGLERLRKSTRDFMFFTGVRTFRVVSPPWMMAGQKTTEEDLQAKIESFWADNPKHPWKEAFSTLYEVLTEAAVAKEKKKRLPAKLKSEPEQGTHPVWSPTTHRPRETAAHYTCEAPGQRWEAVVATNGDAPLLPEIMHVAQSLFAKLQIHICYFFYCRKLLQLPQNVFFVTSMFVGEYMTTVLCM